MFDVVKKTSTRRRSRIPCVVVEKITTRRREGVGVVVEKKNEESRRTFNKNYYDLLTAITELLIVHSRTVLHIHSKPVLSDSIISTPVVGYCVTGCLMLRFHVFSSKCSKLYVLHVRACVCGLKLPQRIGDYL